ELLAEGAQAFPVGLLALERLQVLGNGYARAHRGELAREESLVAMGGESLSELALDQREVLVETLHAAELGDQLDRGLLADAGHAGDVVDAVPHEGEQIGNLLRPDSPLGGDRLLVEPDGLPTDVRREHAHARADQLE